MPKARPEAPREEECPVALAIHAISGKWKMLVLRSLIVDGTQRYNELLVSVGAITAKELTRNLRELEAHGIVSRTARGGQSAYSLTELGLLLQPAFSLFIPLGERLLAGRAHHATQLGAA